MYFAFTLYNSFYSFEFNCICKLFNSVRPAFYFWLSWVSGSFGFWQQGLFTFGFREMGAAVTLLKMFSLQTLLLPDDTTCVSASDDEKNPSADGGSTVVL